MLKIFVEVRQSLSVDRRSVFLRRFGGQRAPAVGRDLQRNDHFLSSPATWLRSV